MRARLSVNGSPDHEPEYPSAVLNNPVIPSTALEPFLQLPTGK
jgi:hypothetical protein